MYLNSDTLAAVIIALLKVLNRSPSSFQCKILAFLLNLKFEMKVQKCAYHRFLMQKTSF